MNVMGRQSATAFVGRNRELAALRRRLAAARAGAGGIVLLAGEPGIGKTRLAEALAQEALQQGVQVGWGRCYQGEGAPPFWLWVQILRACLDAYGTSAVQNAAGAGLEDLAQLVPQLKEHGPAL